MMLQKVAFLALLLIVSEARVGCKNNAGADVDWWIIYKHPKVSNASGKDLQRGASFVYQDADVNGRWTQTNKGTVLINQSIND